jgi:FkbM family methyltransferase
MTSLIDIPKHKDLIYDVGMHKAEDTEFYLRKGFRVISFEADPDLVRQCRGRLGDFIARGQLVIVEGAIIDLDVAENKDRKTIRFYKNDNMSVLGTIHGDWADRNRELGSSSNGVIDVDVIDFAGVIQKYGMPHYMKIDIEGCDMICVNALKKFSKRPDYLSIESDKTSFANIKHEIETLASLGYAHFKAVEQLDIHLTQTPPNPSTEGEFVQHSFEIGSSGLFGSELGGRWKSKRDVIRQYSVIRLGYYLLGDDGVMNRWKFPGAWAFRALVRRFLRLFTRASVPGWYDTHARHSSMETGASS